MTCQTTPVRSFFGVASLRHAMPPASDSCRPECGLELGLRKNREARVCVEWPMHRISSALSES